MEHIKIVLADDHVLVRKGIRAMLESDAEMEVVGEAGNGQEALEAARTLKPDILVLDIRMPQMDGLEAAARVKEYAPGTKTVILSMHDSEEYVLEALNADAYGYLLKDTDKEEFLKALRAVHGGSKYYTGAVSHVLANRLLQGAQRPARREDISVADPYSLSKREKQILRMVIDGKHNKEIAEALDKSQRTIETHRFNIMKKLGVNNAIDMVNKAVRENIA
ncbi:response regulator transcription factor [Fulvivirgaceae bacterium PWU5]|uniref:Response regulator transcription factor n=1 Tax=Dawidia cretensis TaxID=2782350 RepID=A0AAP2DZD1_9BACT|nr:response regulator transcription factor [Dawidia cretensis]MBT1708857.1 response regulator transcription factor [Dawidia cretensis]